MGPGRQGRKSHISHIVEVDLHLFYLPVGKILEQLLVLVMRALPALGPLATLLATLLLRLLAPV